MPVTGGDGFIGSHLGEAQGTRGLRVRVLARRHGIETVAAPGFRADVDLRERLHRRFAHEGMFPSLASDLADGKETIR